MALDLSFSCPLSNGVHARPASALEEVARTFTAEVLILNQRTGQSANAKSVLSLVGADIRFSDPCLLKVSGADEVNAMATLGTFIRNTFPRHDRELPTVGPADGELQLPPVLSNTGAMFRRGTPVVPGLAQGQVGRMGGGSTGDGLPLAGVADVSLEQRRIEAALEELIAWYGQRAQIAGKGIESELLLAHRSLARDEEFRGCLVEAVAARRRTAAGAIADAEAYFSRRFADTGNAIVRERTLDIRDVCDQLLQRIYGNAARGRIITLTEDTILVADTLTPCQFLALDCRRLKGLVLAEAGTTSHTVILARSQGIPTLVGVEKISQGLSEKQEAILDADLGVLVTKLTERARRYYALERERLESRQQILRASSARPGVTGDGQRVEVAANIATAGEATRAFAAGAEAIGLFRTEMLFLDRDSPPDEAEQYEVYQQVMAAAGGQPVIIRTMDIGGDKALAYLNLPAEQNPFLGYRAMRLYPEFAALFRTQVRALVRASAHGLLKTMLPMVATVEEAQWAKRVIQEEQAACARAGIPFDAHMPVGAMIEVPAAVLGLPELCRELDFFSIGSNDLLQYFMAVDRANPRVAPLYNPLQPAFLRLLKQIVDTAHARKRWIGLCGEMAGQPVCLPVLVGLGLDEVSVSAPAIGGLKAGLLRLKRPDCRDVLQRALGCATVSEVTSLLDEFMARQAAPLLAPELVMVDVAAATKEEAIKRGVDLLYIHGRTEHPRAIERAVWQREASYSTGFGYGFAIPHCQTNAVQANSIVLLRLREPIPWGALDESPVKVVVLLVVREREGASQHLKVISTLARQVMREGFRARLEQESDPHALCRFLSGAM